MDRGSHRPVLRDDDIREGLRHVRPSNLRVRHHRPLRRRGRRRRLSLRRVLRRRRTSRERSMPNDKHLVDHRRRRAPKVIRNLIRESHQRLRRRRLRRPRPQTRRDGHVERRNRQVTHRAHRRARTRHRPRGSDALSQRVLVRRRAFRGIPRGLRTAG